MDALETRATKIHDGIIGLVNVVSKERTEDANKAAQNLNLGAAVFAILLLPFQIVPPIFTVPSDGPAKSKGKFIRAIFATAGAVIFAWCCLYGISILHNCLKHRWAKWKEEQDKIGTQGKAPLGEKGEATGSSRSSGEMISHLFHRNNHGSQDAV